MFVNYFDMNDKRYYTGTIFEVKDNGKRKKATFVCYDQEHQKYVYVVQGCRHHVDANNFYKRFLCVTNEVNTNIQMPVQRKTSEFEIDGLFFGWMWYICLMALSCIFYYQILWWIFITVVFFKWRSKKIKKEGICNEWKI